MMLQNRGNLGELIAPGATLIYLAIQIRMWENI